MRGLFAALLIGAALWQGWADWQATIGAGYAYRLTSIAGALEAASSERYRALVAAGEASNIPWLWDPIGATAFDAPLALALLIAAALVWITRKRRRNLF